MSSRPISLGTTFGPGGAPTGAAPASGVLFQNALGRAPAGGSFVVVDEILIPRGTRSIGMTFRMSASFYLTKGAAPNILATCIWNTPQGGPFLLGQCGEIQVAPTDAGDLGGILEALFTVVDSELVAGYGEGGLNTSLQMHADEDMYVALMAKGTADEIAVNFVLLEVV